jgi:catechol 2,3-dioxygenase-like lactoylglutathione lyase family enzyme
MTDKDNYTVDLAARAKVDLEGLEDDSVKRVYAMQPPADMPFRIGKLGHMVMMVRDIDVSVRFYTEVLGFKVSDVYPESMVEGRMVFMRFNDDHHGIGLVGQAKDASHHQELHHVAFEVPTIDDVFRARDHLTKHGVKVDFDGRRRAGSQVSVEFRDPDGHCLEIFWGLEKMGWDDDARPPTEWVPVPSLEDAVDRAPPGQDTRMADPGLRHD